VEELYADYVVTVLDQRGRKVAIQAAKLGENVINLSFGFSLLGTWLRL